VIRRKIESTPSISKETPIMPVIISDETLAQAGMTEREALIEIACRLFDASKLHLWPAAKMAGMSRDEFEVELTNRQIPVYRPTLQDLSDDVATIERLRKRS
jgi:predicted HTH domain antitoxin